MTLQNGKLDVVETEKDTAGGGYFIKREVAAPAATPMGPGAQQRVDPAMKYDGGKLRMDLVPVIPLRELAEVYTYGASKYADENWRKGMSWKRVYGAVLRHLTAWALGEQLDKESGHPHLAHAAWGLFTLMQYQHTRLEFDDREVATSGHCIK